jgi:(2Fe-2S) ferredoxin
MADKRGLTSYRRHIFICGGPKCCSEEQGNAIWNYLKERLAHLGLSDGTEPQVYRSRVNCFRICVDGPICVVYPEGVWYRQVDKEAIDQIIASHLMAGRPVAQYMFAHNRHFADPAQERAPGA